jgi:DNA-binding NtrC family response regulator
MLKSHRILIVDDDRAITVVLKEELSEVSSYEAYIAGNAKEAYDLIVSKSFDVVLLDIQLPRVSGFEVLGFIKEHSPSTQVIMFTQQGDIPTAIKATKQGAYDFITKPYESDVLLATVQRAIEHRQLLIEKEAMRNQLDRYIGSGKIIGVSQGLFTVLDLAKRIAPTNSYVLIEGASGSGKELIAELIHRESGRSARPFIAVNCASIPDTLLESELFGYEKGAFTNANALKQGLVEIANEGTLFLDEVGDISPTIQPKMLRFLESGEFRRVGGTTMLKVDLRVISATNKDLKAEVAAGRFREDLLYRINVVNLRLPALAERREDIPLLANYFISQISKTKRLGVEALQKLTEYAWPGNVRELKHLIESAVLLSQGDVIEPNDFRMNPAIMQASLSTELLPSRAAPASNISLADMEKQHIEEILVQNKFNRQKTAAILGITPKTLYLKIKKYKIRTPKGE